MEYQVVSKEIAWEAAHRLINGYPGNCKNVHGHSWKATVVVALKPRQKLNQYGFVKDFGDFKKLKDWVMEHWDHASMVSAQDKYFISWLTTNRQRMFVFDNNPSSEIIARVLFDKAESLLNDDRCKVVEVRVNETCTSETIYRKHTIR